MAKKKKAGVVFLYPCFPIIGFLPQDRSWTLFHRDIHIEGLEHDPENELCWCSPICVASESLFKPKITQLEFEAITKCPIH